MKIEQLQENNFEVQLDTHYNSPTQMNFTNKVFDNKSTLNLDPEQEQSLNI